MMPKEYLDTTIFDNAVDFAIKAHKGMARKGHKTPFVLHVLEAASICETMTDDLEILAASVLHDVVEDTETSLEDIRKNFGERITELVKGETELCEKGKSHAETWFDRKKAIISRLRNSSTETKIIALGDKLSNIRAISLDFKKKGNELWSVFNNSNPKDIKWYYVELVDVLSELKNYSAYTEFKYLVNKVFDNI